MSYRNNYSSRQDYNVSCTFFTKIGACRHGEKCSKKHIKPTVSKTILVHNLYENPKLNKNNNADEMDLLKLQNEFDQFYIDIFKHFSVIGEVNSIVVCENENNHLNGNVYVKFYKSSDAALASTNLNQEWFNNRPIHCELSPVDSFHDAHCRAYDMNTCERGELCNYMHIRQPSEELKERLFKSQEKYYIQKKINTLKQQLEERKTSYDGNHANSKDSTSVLLQGLN